MGAMASHARDARHGSRCRDDYDTRRDRSSHSAARKDEFGRDITARNDARSTSRHTTSGQRDSRGRDGGRDTNDRSAVRGYHRRADRSVSPRRKSRPSRSPSLRHRQSRSPELPPTTAPSNLTPDEEMQRLMGFGGFTTTKGQLVPDTNTSAVSIKRKTRKFKRLMGARRPDEDGDIAG